MALYGLEVYNDQLDKPPGALWTAGGSFTLLSLVSNAHKEAIDQT